MESFPQAKPEGIFYILITYSNLNILRSFQDEPLSEAYLQILHRSFLPDAFSGPPINFS